MDRAITGFHLDAHRHWVAQLECGHNQHVRHDPPWMLRPWTQSREGRDGRVGQRLDCVKCDEGAPPDFQPVGTDLGEIERVEEIEE